MKITMNSSTYSSAASSSSCASSSSSSIPCSASQSNSSSAASSPSQSQRSAVPVLPPPLQASQMNHTTTTNSVITPTAALSSNNSNNCSWKTINKRSDKRKRKPAEKKIFAKDIPGNIGDRPVDELEQFIQRPTKQQQQLPPPPPPPPRQSQPEQLQHNGHHHHNQQQQQSPTSQLSQPPISQNHATEKVKRTLETKGLEKVKRLSESTAQSSQASPHQAVTFAHHLKVNDDGHYTFGFFDDRPEQKASKISNKINSNSQTNTQANNNNSSNNHYSRKKTLSQNHITENKQRQKQIQPSLISERTYKSKIQDKINVDSFNYDQILKFISNCKYIYVYLNSILMLLSLDGDRYDNSI